MIGLADLAEPILPPAPSVQLEPAWLGRNHRLGISQDNSAADLRPHMRFDQAWLRQYVVIQKQQRCAVGACCAIVTRFGGAVSTMSKYLQAVGGLCGIRQRPLNRIVFAG